MKEANKQFKEVMSMEKYRKIGKYFKNPKHTWFFKYPHSDSTNKTFFNCFMEERKGKMELKNATHNVF